MPHTRNRTIAQCVILGAYGLSWFLLLVVNSRERARPPTAFFLDGWLLVPQQAVGAYGFPDSGLFANPFVVTNMLPLLACLLISRAGVTRMVKADDYFGWSAQLLAFICVTFYRWLTLSGGGPEQSVCTRAFLAEDDFRRNCYELQLFEVTLVGAMAVYELLAWTWLFVTFPSDWHKALRIGYGCLLIPAGMTSGLVLMTTVWLQRLLVVVFWSTGYVWFHVVLAYGTALVCYGDWFCRLLREGVTTLNIDIQRQRLQRLDATDENVLV
jgi:hypothetical protein